MVADQNLVDMSNEPWVEKLNDTSGFTYFDGKLYGLPLASQDYWGFTVNKNVFEKCGLEVPNSREELIHCFGEGTSEKLEFIPYYIGENDTVYASTCCELYAANYGENIDVVKHFFNWCTTDENLQIFYDNLGSTSIFKGVASNTLKPAAKKLMEDMSSGKYGVHLSHNSLIQGQDWDTFIALMQEVYMNDMTPEEFCDEYDNFRYSICVALGMEGF